MSGQAQVTSDLEICPKCKTKTFNAPGIGPYCPNMGCDVIDNLLDLSREEEFVGRELLTSNQRGYCQYCCTEGHRCPEAEAEIERLRAAWKRFGHAVIHNPEPTAIELGAAVRRLGLAK